MGLTVSYMGARSDHIGLGGSNDIGVNINQLDPKYLALGSAALDAQLPNPFLNNPNVPTVAVDSGDAVAGPPAAAFPAMARSDAVVDEIARRILMSREL